MRASLFFSIVTAVVCAGSVAMAQPAPPPPPPVAPPTTPSPAPPPVSPPADIPGVAPPVDAPPPVAPPGPFVPVSPPIPADPAARPFAPMATDPTPPQDAPARDDEIRFRAGISSAVGPAVGDFPGWMVAPVQLRLGMQIVDEVAIVYQNTAYFIFFDAPFSSTDANIVDQNALLAIFTLADLVDLGGGVSLDVFGKDDAVSAGPGLQARAAVNLGPPRDEETGRRIGFNIGVDLHATFVDDDAAVVIPFGLGAEFY